MNWRQEILTEMSREVPPDGLDGAYRSKLQFSQGKYFLYGGKYRRGGLGEVEVPARAVERMLKLEDLQISDKFNFGDIYHLELKLK